MTPERKPEEVQTIILPTNKSHIALLVFKQTAYETRLNRKHANEKPEVKDNLHEAYALKIIDRLLLDGSIEKNSILSSIQSEQNNHFNPETFNYIWAHVYRYATDAEYLGNTLKSEIGRLIVYTNR